MRTKHANHLAFTCALVAAVLAASGGRAGATIGDVDPLVSCADGTAADIGDVKISPGLQTTERKNTITATFQLSGCAADEADLDEIAAESKFGVSKTIAGGRPTPLDSGTAKAKFTTYGDCLGLIIPDPDETGEYPATYGTVQIQWLQGANKVAKSQIFATLGNIAFPTIDGIVTKGLGVGGAFSAIAGFSPSPLDDYNGNANPDLIDCALFADPTARVIYLDVVGPISASITL